MKRNVNKGLVRRIKEKMEEKGIKNAGKLADEAGVGYSFVYDVLSGRSYSPTVSKLEKVAKILDVTVPYLIYGNDEREHLAIPVIDVEASMGGGNIIDMEEEAGRWIFDKEWIKNITADTGNLNLIKVVGDSMEPTLEHGDMIMVDLNQFQPRTPGIFVLRSDGGLFCKRIDFVTSSSGPRFRITSDNKNYESYEVSAEDAHIIGKVIWVSRKI